MSRDCVYDGLNHQYTCKGQLWPSVTQTLVRAGHIDTTFLRNEDALVRGREVHKYTMALDVLKTLRDVDLSPRVGAPLEAYQAFVRDKRPTWWYIERAFWHRALRYGGRPDRVFRQFAGCDGPGVLEIKTGGESDWHALQLAGYQRLRPAGSRWVLYLGDDGRYRLRMCREATDHSTFLAALKDTWRTWPTTTAA